MNDELRRRRDEGDELERALLGAAATDTPSAASRAAAARALGLDTPTTGGGAGGGAGDGGSATGAPSGATGGGAATASAPTDVTASGASAVGGWISGGLAVVVVVGLIAWRMMGTPAIDASGEPDAPAAPTAPSAAATDRDETTSPRPTTEPVLARTPATEPSDAVQVEPAAPAAGPGVASPVGPRRRTVPATDTSSASPVGADDETTPASLAAELALIDAARTANRAHDAARALSTLDEYARTFPHGTLAQEATVARIEALRTSGDAERARAVAERFLAEHPGSPAARRVRQLVPELAAPQKPAAETAPVTTAAAATAPATAPEP